MLPSYLKLTYSNLFPSTVFPCQRTSCSNLSFQSVFLLSFLQPAVCFHTAKVVVQKCKSDHVTTLLNFLQGPPMSLRMKSVPWPTWLYLVCTYVFLWPHLPSVFDSSPLYRFPCLEHVPACLLLFLERTSLKTQLLITQASAQVSPSQRRLPPPLDVHKQPDSGHAW